MFKSVLYKSRRTAALILALALCFAGCGKDVTPAQQSAAPQSGAGAVKTSSATAPAEGTEAGFVSLTDAVPDAVLEIRYYSTFNFVGERVDGYEQPCALLTREAAESLRGVSDSLAEKGYRLKIYDAYRPQTAVDHFERWAEDPNDTKMKEYFYPELEKTVLIPQGYIAEKSGHSRGSTVDLTLLDMKTGRDLDMGGGFDYFGLLSHPDFTDGLTEEQLANRQLLRDAMIEGGFVPLDTEWWHFTLDNEPYPDTYFDFPVSFDSVA